MFKNTLGFMPSFSESPENRTEHITTSSEKTPWPVTSELLLQVLYHTAVTCIHEHSAATYFNISMMLFNFETDFKRSKQVTIFGCLTL